MFRRGKQDDEIETPDDEAEDLPASEDVEDTDVLKSRRRFLLFGRKSAEDAPDDEPDDAAPKLPVPDKRPPLPDDPLARDEAMAPLTMEVAGSRHFTVAVGPARAPGAKPVELPAVVLGDQRRRAALPWRRRRDPLDEVAALVPAEEPEAEAVLESTDAEVETEIPAEPVPEAPERKRRLRPGQGLVLVVGLLLLAVAMVGLLINVDALPASVGELWPLVPMALGVLMMPPVLRARDSDGLFGALGLVAFGASVLLSKDGAVPLGASLGATLSMAFGVAVVVLAGFARGRERQEL
jgi:hypothetical protein